MSNRREFIALLGGAAVAWPFAARAQQAAMPVVGFLSSVPFETRRDQVAGFHRGLNESGYVEAQNVAIEYRSADNQIDRLPTLAADLVSRGVTVIVTIGGDNSIRAAKAASTTIPVVFVTGFDPVAAGFVASLNRPGGNLTGVNFVVLTVAKRLGLLSELAPAAATIGMLVNPEKMRYYFHVMSVKRAWRDYEGVSCSNADDAKIQAGFMAIEILRLLGDEFAEDDRLKGASKNSSFSRAVRI
jgi:putative ABC transport system substrate-binding protein